MHACAAMMHHACARTYTIPPRARACRQIDLHACGRSLSCAARRRMRECRFCLVPRALAPSSRRFFEAVAARLRPRSVITLIYATQHAGCKDAHRTPPARSRAYVSAAIQLLRSRGFEVRERADGEPDADMTYMCRARTLVLAGGGYTRLAGECARAFDAARPATVLGLAAPATDLVELPRAYRNSRRDALDADKARRAAKKQRESSA